MSCRALLALRWIRYLSVLSWLLCLEDSPPGDFHLPLAPLVMSKESCALGTPLFITLPVQGQGSAGSQLLPVPSLGLCPSLLVILQVDFVPLGHGAFCAQFFLCCRSPVLGHVGCLVCRFDNTLQEPGEGWMVSTFLR